MATAVIAQVVQPHWAIDAVFAASSGGRSIQHLQRAVELRHQGLPLRHIDVKKLARFCKVGDRITGNRQQADLLASDTTGSTWPSTTPHDWPTSRCCPMSNRAQQSLLNSGIGLVQRPWRRVSSGDERQRIGLHLQGLCQSLQRPQAQAHLHQALHATDQRQSRTVHSGPLQGMGLRHAVQNSQERNAWMTRYLSIYNRLRKHSDLSVDLLSSGSIRCCAEQRGETQHLGATGSTVIGRFSDRNDASTSA